MSWETPTLTILCVVTFGLWWYRSLQSGSPSRSGHLHAGLTGLAVLYDFHARARDWCTSTYDAAINAPPIEQLKMVLTLGAIVWLLHRSWQTLWKPVPELVNILGVDIPLPPDVCLAGIGADSATLSWTRPTHRPVQRYLIQVNGVLVGESPANETAITVTGLKPNHFYNIRVVAIGQNNFRTGSPLIRLKTFGKDGRPQLGNSRLPTSFVDPDHPRESGDESDNSDRPPVPFPTVEAAAVLDTSASSAPRDPGPSIPGQRRNTVNRRHSPSVASTDQPQIRAPASSETEMSLAELNEKFESIRKEIEDTQAQFAKDEAEAQQQEEELRRERDRKRQALKEKEEQTTQLRAMVRSTMEQMRAAEKERAKMEQQLKDKESKKAKVRDNIAKFENEVERMKREREGFETQKSELAKNRDQDVERLDQENAELQENCTSLEAELKDKGKQLQDLKATREQLPGADDEQWKEEDLRLRREWEFKRREIHNRLVAETKHGHLLSQQIRTLQEQLMTLQQQAGTVYYGQPGSSMDFDPTHSGQHKRLSHGSNTLPVTTLPSPERLAPAEPSFQASIGFGNPSFAPGLFMDMAGDGVSEPQTEAELKAAGGPLSPSAQTLLPSNIFEESEDADAMDPDSPILPEPITAGEDGPQSPASSIMSFPVFSSPQGSSQHLPFPPYTDNSDRNSLHMNSSPPPAPSGLKLTSLFATRFQRNRGSKASEEGGPPIGTLKPGQSQSFPTVSEENEPVASRRRLNFPSWMNRNSVGPDTASGGPPITVSGPLAAWRLNPLKGSPSGAFPDREGQLSRPASIASTELPRPSTDSGSIWGTPGDGLGLGMNRLWSPSEGRWPSRSGSRRPSLQGSNALTTTLASADDEILDDHDLLNPKTMPSKVGVIGSRPPGSSKSMSQRLNPNAPTFMGNMGNIFRKDRDKDKDRAKDKGKGSVAGTPSIELPPSLDDSPSDSRMSRDTQSVHTQPSVSESHESLQLDSAVSNTASETNLATSYSKDPENVVRKLFRKGSSSKFSLSSRLGKDSGLFKKTPGSASNSDKNMSAEHRSSLGDLDDLGEDAGMLGRSLDSMASSPSLGPSKSKEGREGGRMSSWRFSMSSIKKKGKDAPAREKESLELERAQEDE
ncbi:Fibronectin type III domain-containingprotein [Purpureocillium lavendulum]|uniref:Fibronectin type III domain-containingprotein n=1 Tax=Purpureocillium lavendulum TaxID=1247861 RepID=A0AB34FVW0_9HYPO|nr:Fibronectin type III domain-containingprotein [Purpureocillium lavendulum]